MHQLTDVILSHVTLPKIIVVENNVSVVTSVVEYDELGTGNVERAQIDTSSPV